MPVNTRLQVRRGTSVEWTNVNPTLYAGELGYETNTGRFKIGDGTTSWTSLDYAIVTPTDFLAGSGISVNVANDGSTVTYSLSDPTIQLADITDLSSNGRNFLLTPSSSNLAALVTDETGSGSLVFASGASLSNVTLSGSINIGSDSLSEVIEDIIGNKVKAGSNITISYNDTNGETTVSATGVSLVGHTHILTDITDVTASATEVNYIDGSVPGTGVAGKAVVLDSGLNITNLGNVSTTGTLTVGGDLIVNGATTTVNSTITTLDDPIITLGGDTAPTSDDAKDRGVEFRYYSSGAKIGFFGYDNSTGKFIFLTDATNTSEAFSGTAGEIDAKIDWTNVNNKPDPVISVSLSGDVSGSGNVTLTDLASGGITINTTIGANSVALGTDTTGNYVASISNGNYITGGDGGSEGAALTLGVDATSANTANKVVARDGSGNFAASTITASGLTGLSSINPVTISYAIIDGGSP